MSDEERRQEEKYSGSEGETQNQASSSLLLLEVPKGTPSSSRLKLILILSFQYIAVFVQRVRDPWKMTRLIGSRCKRGNALSRGVLIDLITDHLKAN